MIYSWPFSVCGAFVIKYLGRGDYICGDISAQEIVPINRINLCSSILFSRFTILHELYMNFLYLWYSLGPGHWLLVHAHEHE